MSKFLPIESANPIEIANTAQKIKYHGYTKCLEIPINASDNTNLIGLIFLEDSFIGLEGWTDKSNKRPNSFPMSDLSFQ